MDSIIGIGGVGCRIAKKFEDYSQYSVYLVDDEEWEGKKSLVLPKQNSVEDYERKCPSVKRFFTKLTDQSLVIVSGASLVSASTLAILEQIAPKTSLNVLYVQPEVDLLSETKQLCERTVRGVLQHYARSGMLERVFMVSNEQLESVVDDVSIANFYDSLNNFLVYTFHMVNVFNHIDSVTDTFSEPSQLSRICTLGVLDFESGEEKLFFPLDFQNEVRYYYNVTEERLNKDKGLRKKIVNQVKSKKTDNKQVSFGIYESEMGYDAGYLLCFSKATQDIEN